MENRYIKNSLFFIAFLFNFPAIILPKADLMPWAYIFTDYTYESEVKVKTLLSFENSIVGVSVV